MRVVIQRVSSSSVRVAGEVTEKTGKGLLVFLGIEDEDGEEDVKWLVSKVIQIRIFDDSEGIMNLSVKDVNGDVLVVSQFTLHASTKKGNRPGYSRASKPDVAITLYEKFIRDFEKEFGKKVATGIFGADMQVELVNDGPVTIFIDSKNRE